MFIAMDKVMLQNSVIVEHKVPEQLTVRGRFIAVAAHTRY